MLAAEQAWLVGVTPPSARARATDRLFTRSLLLPPSDGGTDIIHARQEIELNYSLLRLSGFDSSTEIVLHIAELIHDRRISGTVCCFAGNDRTRIDTPHSSDASRDELTERHRFRVS